MATIEELRRQYRELDDRFDSAPTATTVEEIDATAIRCFEYEYPGSGAEVTIDTDEFTAVCPWTDLPDYGTLTVRYVPDRSVIEFKSL